MVKNKKGGIKVEKWLTDRMEAIEQVNLIYL